MPKRPVGLDMKLSQPTKLLRTKSKFGGGLFPWWFISYLKLCGCFSEGFFPRLALIPPHRIKMVVCWIGSLLVWSTADASIPCYRNAQFISIHFQYIFELCPVIFKNYCVGFDSHNKSSSA